MENVTLPKHRDSLIKIAMEQQGGKREPTTEYGKYLSREMARIRAQHPTMCQQDILRRAAASYRAHKNRGRAVARAPAGRRRRAPAPPPGRRRSRRQSKKKSSKKSKKKSKKRHLGRNKNMRPKRQRQADMIRQIKSGAVRNVFDFEDDE